MVNALPIVKIVTVYMVNMRTKNSNKSYKNFNKCLTLSFSDMIVKMYATET